MHADERITENFTLQELIASDIATRNSLDNTPGEGEVQHLRRLTVDILQWIRDKLDSPVIVTSGYRSRDVNAMAGGDRHSAHIDGRAADIKVFGLRPGDVALWMASSKIPFDKLILEFGAWCHVQVPKYGRAPRCATYTAVKLEGRTVYLEGLRPQVFR